MVHLPGSPNTEVEAQHFSQLLMLTGATLIQSGFDISSSEMANPEEIESDKDAIVGLFLAMVDKVLDDPGSFYGNSESQKLRAEFMVSRAVWNFNLLHRT